MKKRGGSRGSRGSRGGRGGRGKAAQSTTILRHRGLASHVATCLCSPLWQEWAVARSGGTSGGTSGGPSGGHYTCKLVGALVTNTILERCPHVVETTSSRSARARVSVMVSKILFRIASAINTDAAHAADAVVHDNKSSLHWEGQSGKSRGSGILLSERGMCRFAWAAQCVGQELVDGYGI